MNPRHQVEATLEEMAELGRDDGRLIGKFFADAIGDGGHDPAYVDEVGRRPLQVT